MRGPRTADSVTAGIGAVAIGAAGLWAAGLRADGLTPALIAAAAAALLVTLGWLVASARRPVAVRSEGVRARGPIVVGSACLALSALWATGGSGPYPALLALASGAACAFGLFSLLVPAVPAWQRRLRGD